MLSELDNFSDEMYIKTKISKYLATAKTARFITTVLLPHFKSTKEFYSSGPLHLIHEPEILIWPDYYGNRDSILDDIVERANAAPG